mgnify:CR=1 FL=1
MTAAEAAPRFEFGKNWHKFVKRHFSEERLQVAERRILDFLGVETLDGYDFLDIGCGSGIHSYAAFSAGAGKVRGFDYDQNSVEASLALRQHAGQPPNWEVGRGDVLDDDYVASLGKWNLVYSWGVLHHTGEMWHAIENAQRTVADGGLFYIALYSSDADFQPSKEFWLEVKQRYNKASPLRRSYMVLWYVWRFGMQGELKRLPDVIKQIVTYRVKRGMNYFADVRDWLGGWPMEYAGDQETVDFLEDRFGFQLVNVKTGEACSEFLFKKTGINSKKTDVLEFLAEQDAKPAKAPEIEATAAD